MTSKENFLTEAFAHILKIDTNLACKWLEYCDVLEFEQDSLRISTQVPYSDDGVPIIPDMVIKGGTKSGQSFTIWHEHKWDDYAIKDKLIKYKEYLKKKEPENKLIFIGKHAEQISSAKLHCDKALLWADVYRFLEVNDSAADLYANRMKEQLLDFMKKEQLTLERLSIQKMRAYYSGDSSDETFLEDCRRMVDQLSTCDWSFIPDYFTKNEAPVVKHKVGKHPYRKQNWGRTGIEFVDWVNYPEPGIFMGFLLDHSDHHMDPIDPENIAELPENIAELMFTIDVGEEYKDALIQSDLNVYAEKIRGKLPGTEIFGPLKMEGMSPWRKLVIRETLSNVIQGKEKTAQEQVEVIYHRLKDWCNVVFEDGKVEKIFRDLFENKAT